MKITNTLFFLIGLTFSFAAQAKTPSLSVEEYLNRQRSVYYVGQQVLQDYDQKLDVIYNKTVNQQSPSNEEATAFTKARFNSLLAWEFSENHMHDMVERYNRVLRYANTQGSPYQKSAKEVLTKAKAWMNNEWQNGDKNFVVYLAREINDPTLAQYLSLPANFKALSQPQKKSALDLKIENEWAQFRNQKSTDDEQEFLIYNNSFSMPKILDPLEPSSGPNGHVTGNRFPTGKWAMTFDDGPHKTHTQGMVNNLSNNGVHGTFFWQTKNILALPSFPKTKSPLYSRASHSYTHANLEKASSSSLNKEINQAVTDFAKVVGEKPTMYRCPYGSCGKNNGTIRKMIAAQNMLHIAWNVDTLDWQDKNPDSIFARSKKQIDSLGRGIVLFHDIHPQSVTASDKVIKYLKSKYKVEPLNKLIEEARGKPYYTP